MLFIGCVVSTSKRGLMLAGAGGAALAEDVLGALTGAPSRFPVSEKA
jgi:hypothetical protein